MQLCEILGKPTISRLTIKIKKIYFSFRKFVTTKKIIEGKFKNIFISIIRCHCLTSIYPIHRDVYIIREQKKSFRVKLILAKKCSVCKKEKKIEVTWVRVRQTDRAIKDIFRSRLNLKQMCFCNGFNAANCPSAQDK